MRSVIRYAAYPSGCYADRHGNPGKPPRIPKKDDVFTPKIKDFSTCRIHVILKEVAAIECDFSLSPMDKKRTIDDRMKLYPGFDGISEWLYKHGLEA
ncbi:hypothetical protein PAA26_03660 [Methanomassiliicoccaceae archaeon COG_1]|nr:hypothetical protein [Methanomassiliicoccaceae archaeon COG_1]